MRCAAAASVLGAAHSAAAAGAVVYDYVNQASWTNTGPSADPACGYKWQSPIDIPTQHVHGVGAKKTMAEVQHYTPVSSGLQLNNNGHGLKVAGSFGHVKFTLPFTQQYNAVQFHFHCPSEHSVDGKLYDCEMHIVHQKTGATGLDDLLVVGVLFKQGAANPFLTSLGFGTGNLPASGAQTAIPGSIDLAASFSAQFAGQFWRYDGSLTTPPCTQSVKWFVMQTPAEMSAAQVNEFNALYPSPQNNRAVQPRNGRGIISGDYSSASAVTLYNAGGDDDFAQKWFGWAVFLCVALPLLVVAGAFLVLRAVRAGGAPPAEPVPQTSAEELAEVKKAEAGATEPVEGTMER